MGRHARISGTATALPEHRYPQADVLEHARALFPRMMSRRDRSGIFERAGVRTRYLVEPKDYYFRAPSFAERNRDYLKHALALAERSIREALDGAGLEPKDVDHILSVTTTGLLTPSLEAHLAHHLPFSKGVKRTPIFGVGCAGGVVGLARAADYVSGRPRDTALLLSVELCSLTYLPGEDSMPQLVAAALFGDGAAAVVVRGDAASSADGPSILDSASLLLPDSLGLMGWDFSDGGMRLVLSPTVPREIEAHLGPAVAAFLARSGLKPADVGTWLFHPGSLKVIDACERALGLGPDDTRCSRRFLEEHGNLSSASILFILRDVVKNVRPQAGSYGVVGAMGPGFSCELLLLRFA